MKPQNLLNSLAVAVLFLASRPLAKSQEAPDTSQAKPVGHERPADENRENSHKIMLAKHIQLTGGQLTLPFKIRPKATSESFRLTTDVTIGGYMGATYQFSEEREYFVTVPLTAGLTFINLDNRNTTLDLESADSDLIPGITWSTGLIFQFGDCTLGLVGGKDFASEVGNQWDYHGKWWWSFSIGYVFLN